MGKTAYSVYRWLQICFIGRFVDSTVSDVAGIEPLTN